VSYGAYGVLWCLVVSYGAYGVLWCLMVGVLIIFIRSSVYSANLAQDKIPRRAIFTKVMVQTAQQKAALRTKKALENGKISFKPRGEVNRALFEIMKKEFDKKAEEINTHASLGRGKCLEKCRQIDFHSGVFWEGSVEI
jgi:hypothetical protein